MSMHLAFRADYDYFGVFFFVLIAELEVPVLCTKTAVHCRSSTLPKDSSLPECPATELTPDVVVWSRDMSAACVLLSCCLSEGARVLTDQS